MQNTKFIIGALMAASLTTTILSSCGDDKAKANQQQSQVMPYNVIKLTKGATTLYSEYPARLQGVQDIDIRPMIDGYIEKVHVDEGQAVRAGQVLFTIKNPQYEQNAANAAASIKSAEAAVAAAKLQVQKTKPLVDQGIISAYEMESAQLNLNAQEANLAQARASYNNAKINVGYTSVTSPVSGVVGLLPYRLGSYVNSGTAQPLTTVSDISKIYAYFSINEKAQLAFAANAPGANFQEKIQQLPPIQLLLSNGEIYPKEGKVESFSGQVNVQTGSFNVRASFVNENGMLRSGSSATVRIPTHIQDAIIIPQNATTELQNKRLAYIVGEGNKVKVVAITVRPVPGGKYFVVDSGLAAGDQLIVEGIGIITEGKEIQPKVIATDSVLAEPAN